MSKQSETILEENLLKQLETLEYERVVIKMTSHYYRQCLCKEKGKYE